MQFRVWGRKRNDSSALWFDLPYGATTREHAEYLLDYYSDGWGAIYEYEVIPVGSYPQGMREPCFV